MTLPDKKSSPLSKISERGPEAHQAGAKNVSLIQADQRSKPYATPRQDCDLLPRAGSGGEGHAHLAQIDAFQDVGPILGLGQNARLAVLLFNHLGRQSEH